MKKLFALLTVFALLFALSLIASSIVAHAEDDTTVTEQTVEETAEEKQIKYVPTDAGYASIDNAVVGKTGYYDAVRDICAEYGTDPDALFSALGQGRPISQTVAELFGLSPTLARIYEEYFLEKCRQEIVSPNASNQYTIFAQYLFNENKTAEAEAVDDTTTEAVTTAAEATETETAGITIEDLQNAVADAENREEALMNIASLFGCDESKAGKYLDAFIKFGDEHFEESGTWQKLKTDLQENRKFWILVIVVSVALVVLIGNLVVMLMNKSSIATTKRGVLKYAANSDEINVSAKKIAEDANVYWRAVDEKYSVMLGKFDEELKAASEYREKIAGLEQELTLLTADEAAKNMFNYKSSAYMLEILYLLTRRLELPLDDKAAIDKWYANSIGELNKLVDSATAQEATDVNKQINPGAGDPE